MTQSRNKGNALELKVAKAFSDTFGLTIRRTPLSGGWSHDNPETAGDLVCTTPGADFPYCVECKNVEGWQLESIFTEKHKWFDAWWEQTLSECHDNKQPILVFSKAYAPILAAVRLADWDADVMSSNLAALHIYMAGRPVVIVALSDLLAYLYYTQHKA